jgi:hypothetical protein
MREFDLIHADLLGEGSISRTATRSRSPRVPDGMAVVSCALGLVEADMPVVAVRPRREKPFTLPDRLRRYSPELGEFNRSFQLFSASSFAATAIVDQRTIGAIQDSTLAPRSRSAEGPCSCTRLGTARGCA